MTAMSSGFPEVPVRPIATRRVARRIQVGPVAVGGGDPVSVRSTTTTRTSDIGTTPQRIAELTGSGCRLVRVACPTRSPSAPPAEEVEVGIQSLESLHPRQRGLEIVSCPSRGRARVDVCKPADEVTAGPEGMAVPLRVAVMGGAVRRSRRGAGGGPGGRLRPRQGASPRQGRGRQDLLPESEIEETFVEEAMRIAERKEQDGVVSGEPAVTVSRTARTERGPERDDPGEHSATTRPEGAVRGGTRRPGR